MDPAKPSLDLVRSVTDEHVLRALMRHRRLTRAELAVETGISKPTAGESVRRLTERGLLVDTGERSPGGRGRGRVGSYYALADGTGAALAVGIAPDGIVAEGIDVYGTTIARSRHPVGRPAEPVEVTAALEAVVAEVVAALPNRPRHAVVSAADPVDRASGRLVQLPDAPFLVGALDPVDILTPLVVGSVFVDNDVNWAAQAERDHAESLRDFAYLYLGEGLGCAVVSDGRLQRGTAGLAGEIAHLITTGPTGQAVPFIDVFRLLDLRRPGSTAINVPSLLARHAEPTTGDALSAAIAGVVAAIVALTDPQRVIIGGDWGPALLNGIREATARLPRPPSLSTAAITNEPAMFGVRADTLDRLRESIITSV